MYSHGYERRKAVGRFLFGGKGRPADDEDGGNPSVAATNFWTYQIKTQNLLTNHLQKSTMTSADTTKPMSKRQRRAQGSNPSTTWQQQPRIKSAASRARAYINYAGLNDDDDDNHHDDGNTTTKSKKKKGSTTRKVQEMLDPELDLNSPEVKFGRMLGGTEQRVRHKAVKMLRHYLTQRVDIANGAGISELDLMKLWKVSASLF